MRVFVTGASGLIGNRICRALLERGDEIVALSREERTSEIDNFTWVRGDVTTLEQWESAVSGCDGVINLAGASVAKRWTQRQKAHIIASRVGITTALYHAIAHASQPPAVLLNASAIGFYGTHANTLHDETSPAGSGFLATVCVEWEMAARRVETLGARVLLLRLGVVLANDGGALPAMLRPLRAFTGGNLGDGKQWVSWIHIDDAVGEFLNALDNHSLRGAINLVANEPVRQRDLINKAARILGKPAWLDAPAWALKILMGQMAKEMLLSGQHVVQAIPTGYELVYPDLDSALNALLT